MKICFLFVLLSTILLSQSLNAQSGAAATDTTVRYYARLASSSSEADKIMLESKLYQLLTSENENDWLTAQRFFTQLRKRSIADSITTAVKIKFPRGITVRMEKLQVVYNEKNPVEKEKLYKAWMSEFPPKDFGANRILYDYARNAVSTAYVEADNIKKAMEYANMIETPSWKGQGWAATGYALERKGHLNEAAELIKKARDHAFEYLTVKRTDENARFVVMGFTGYSNSLSEILYKQKKYAEAVKYAAEAHDSSNRVVGAINTNYAKALIALKKDNKAFEIIDESVKAGQATQEMKEALKKLYVKVKGSNAGYDEYMMSLNKILLEKIKADLSKQIVKQPSPMFTLKDVNGNTVSLSDLKGKIIVVDFWATWCGPCKKSFPSMQMAVDRFKDDPNVKFLFIHTWEREKEATAEAKKYITDNKYSFEVLMDLKESDGTNKVASGFRVQGIPTKFVIDGEGNIRFRFTGFSGDEEAAVEELAMMIDMAKNVR